MARVKGKVSTLGFALLGLIRMQPASGYELRRIFAETPMAGYSNSPGAIYPALQNLKMLGLVREQAGIGRTGREKRTLQCSAAGTKELLAWLRQEVTPESLHRELDVVLLRFSFLDQVHDLGWSMRFLEQFQDAAKHYRAQLANSRTQMKPYQPLHGQLALQNGEQILEAHAKWANTAIAAIQHERKKRR